MTAGPHALTIGTGELRGIRRKDLRAEPSRVKNAGLARIRSRQTDTREVDMPKGRRDTGRLVTVLLLAYTAVSCSSVALTGRQQLNLVPDSEMLSTSTQQYDQFMKENKASADSAGTQRIRRVGARIQAAVEEYARQTNHTKDLNGYAWEFNLVESKEVNAWCMPGGKVVFYSGIMPVCQDDNGVAVVMGHEVAHAVAKHGNERMSQGLLVQMGGTALGEALHSKPAATQQLMLPFGRAQESEADHLGLIFMSMAGYDPHHAVEFWQRMSEATGGAEKPPEFMSTHPADANRIKKIQEEMPEALKYYKKP
jgi:predicted Zn-dependent protease